MIENLVLIDQSLALIGNITMTMKDGANTTPTSGQNLKVTEGNIELHTIAISGILKIHETRSLI